MELTGAVKSARRVLQLFELFAERRAPLSVSEIVSILNYPQSSTSVLLKSLMKLGYLDYDRHKRLYKPTMRVALFGSWMQDELFTHANLSRVVDRLHAATEQTVIIGMRNDVHVQYIHLAQALDGSYPVYVRPGTLRSLCRSAMGKVLLAQNTDVDALLILRRINAEESKPENRIAPSDLVSQLEEIRAQGFAYSEGSATPGIGVVAVEIPTPPSQPRMSLGIAGTLAVQKERRGEFLALMQTAMNPYRYAAREMAGVASNLNGEAETEK